MTRCSSCHMPHDLDLAPDTGSCVSCGGTLVDGGESPVETRARVAELAGDVVRSLARKARVRAEEVGSQIVADQAEDERRKVKA